MSDSLKKVPNSIYDILANIISLVLFLGIAIYLAINWDGFPDMIPGRYGFDGTVTSWTNKNELIFMPIIGLGVFVLMTFMERSAQIWNTSATITKKNKELLDRTMKSALSTIKLVVSAASVFITFNSSLATDLPSWFVPIFFTLSLGPLALYYIMLMRAK
jgi:uncharacterized membrane protein